MNNFKKEELIKVSFVLEDGTRTSEAPKGVSVVKSENFIAIDIENCNKNIIKARIEKSGKNDPKSNLLIGASQDVNITIEDLSIRSTIGPFKKALIASFSTGVLNIQLKKLTKKDSLVSISII